jgi:peptidoglycan/xylan/chitin deacetylase (PgdA/CDA1 family)
MSLFRAPGFRRIRQTARSLISRRQPHVVILGYHRVAECQHDPFDLAVTPDELDEHLALLARIARPVTLHDAVTELAGGRIVSRTVCVTFDDGYEDTLTAALPLLRKYNVPATVFVTTGNSGAPFWWDVLAHCVMEPTHLPDRIALDVRGRRKVYRTGNRAQLIRAVATLCRSSDPAERTDLLLALKEQVQWRDSGSIPRALHAHEIESLAAEPLVDIGAHTVTHPPLATLAAARQRSEIEESRQALASLTGAPPRSFSYPHGSLDAGTRELVRQAGFTVACCSVPDVATPASDPLALPRLWVDGNRKRRFARWVNRWLG